MMGGGGRRPGRMPVGRLINLVIDTVRVSVYSRPICRWQELSVVYDMMFSAEW